MTQARLLVPLDETREVLGGVSESTVRRLYAAGLLESAKLGRRRMTVAASLDGLVDRLRIQDGPAGTTSDTNGRLREVN